MDFGNINNVKSGPCLIYIDDGSGERLVGLTIGDVEFSIEPNIRERKFHQYGDTAYDYVLQGLAGKVKFSAAETDVDNLKLAIPFGVIFTDGSKKSFGVGLKAGTKLRELAVKIRIHPINQLGTGGDDDPDFVDDDVTVWKCLSMEAFTRKISATDDRTFDISLTVLVDDDKASDYCLWIEGDPAVASIDTTPPTVETVKAEVSSVLTLIPADASGLSNVDVNTTIEIVFAEECKSWMAVQEYITIIADSDKSAIAGIYVHSVVTGTPNKSKVVFTPDSALSAATKYRVLIGGMKDITGNTMSGITDRVFETAS